MKPETKKYLQALLDSETMQVGEFGARWEDLVLYDALSWVATIEQGKIQVHNYLRIKPRTITIGDMEVPEPLREMPESGYVYWPALSDESFAQRTTVVSNHDDWERNMLRRGLLHATAEAAIAHAKALIKISGGEV